MSDTDMQTGHEELWKQVFGEGHPVLVKKQRRFLKWPNDPRCKLCYAPFAGFGGFLVRLTGLMPSDRNPHYCNKCDGFLQAFPGGAEVEMTVLILDIRGSVDLSGRISPRQFAETVNRMREITSAVLAENRGFILEFQGDSVVAVFPPGFTGEDHAEMGISAARSILEQSLTVQGTDEPLSIGIGVHTGPVYICTVTAAGGNMQGVSVFGQNVNFVARLSAAATAGQALVSPETFAAAGMEMPRQDTIEVDLKGIEGTSSAVLLS
ncbi:adenylate/guanylate cyclase domain-containing protein [uncultured Roseobacter sp.]|uniref:adenylate/guanylate cyclase domain-containing protein n=1 Tax=uncultured Roseobacter sp. TaxID=114847 RepID=UPI002603EB52|nr:adenylate/guanylate cyclase domain-containing protein [uncultured Roseobacter sp.]